MRVGRRHVGRGARLLRAGVRVRVHRRQPRAALHQTVKVERDAVARCTDFYARYFVVAQCFVVVHLEREIDLYENVHHYHNHPSYLTVHHKYAHRNPVSPL